MKMEVLLVQNQFQRELLGPKLGVQDWDRSFKRPSPPPSPPPVVSNKTTTTSTTVTSSQHNYNNNHHHHHHYQHQHQNRITNAALAGNDEEEAEDRDAVEALARRIQHELKEAKRQHLDCTEVLLPSDLLQRVASDMLVMSEKEPCGIRGCTIFIEFQEEPNNVRRIASLKPDPDTVSTFEFYLTLVQNRSSWSSILPGFLKNLARGGTIVISSEFKLIKNKLYRSFAE